MNMESGWINEWIKNWIDESIKKHQVILKDW